MAGWPMTSFVFPMNFINLINLNRSWGERLQWEYKLLLMDSVKHLQTHMLNYKYLH